MNNVFELTSFERMMSNYCQTGDLIGMALAFVSGKYGMALKQETVHRALEFMQDRHPFLHSYLDSHRDEDRMFLVVLEDESCYRDKIELEWKSADSREDAIKLNADFNSKIFQHSNKNVN